MSVAAAAPCPVLNLPARLPTPATEPPFDDAIPPPRALRVVPAEPMPGSLTLPFPPAVPIRVRRPTLRLVPDTEVDRAPLLPELRDWAETTAMAIAQILTGERPPGPLRAAVVPGVYAALSRRAALAAQAPRQRASLRAVQVCSPAHGIAEVVTVVHGLPRPKALAFRLEARRTRWVCTALELG